MGQISHQLYDDNMFSEKERDGNIKRSWMCLIRGLETLEREKENMNREWMYACSKSS